MSFERATVLALFRKKIGFTGERETLPYEVTKSWVVVFSL